MSLTRASLEKLIGESGGNRLPIHLYISSGHVNTSDDNSGLDPNFPLETWLAAAAKLPTRTSASIFWHTGPGVYEIPEIKEVALDGAHIYVIGDGAGTFADSRTVLTTKTVLAVTSDDVFTVVGGALGFEQEYQGKSLRWLTTANGNHGSEFTGVMRLVAEHTDAQIMLSEVTSNPIAAGDTFEIFVPTTFLDQETGLGPPLKFANIGVSEIDELRGEESISLLGASPDIRSSGSLVFINIGVTQSDNSNLSNISAKSASLMLFGVQTSVGVGQGPGSGTAPFILSGTNTTIRLGFETIDPSFQTFGTDVITTDFGLSGTTAWTGWGLGTPMPDPAAFPAMLGLTIFIGPNVVGYYVGNAIEPIGCRLAFIGNSVFHAGLVGIGIIALQSDISFVRITSNSFGVTHVGGYGGAACAVFDSNLFFQGVSDGLIHFDGATIVGFSTLQVQFEPSDKLLFRNTVDPAGENNLPSLLLHHSEFHSKLGSDIFIVKPAATTEGSVDLVGAFPGAGTLDTLTIIVAVDNGSTQTVTFVTPANAAAVVTQINAQTTGLTAQLGVDHNGLQLISDEIYVTGAIEIVTGTANAALGLVAQYQDTTEGTIGFDTGPEILQATLELDSRHVGAGAPFSTIWSGDAPWVRIRRVVSASL
jgi:hypothetical protein